LFRIGLEQSQHEGVATGELMPPERLLRIQPRRAAADLDRLIEARHVTILAVPAALGIDAVAPF
jgi:hypothetical protein